MHIIHRVGFRCEADDTDLLRELSIAIPTDRFVWFDIDEADPLWPKVEVWLAMKGRGTTVSTKFTKKELDSAAWLTIKSLLYHGYPQPDDDFGYGEVSYDLEDYCEACSIGLRQECTVSRMFGEIVAEIGVGRRGASPEGSAAPAPPAV